MGAFGSYQNEIYLGGLGDVVPELPADLTRLEAMAEERMPATAFGYVAGSAGSEATARANRAAFDAWRIVPRMLRDVSYADLSVTGSERRCPHRWRWRRSASSGSRPSRRRAPRSPERPPRLACRWSSALLRRRRSRTSPRPVATRRGGTSSTGRRIASLAASFLERAGAAGYPPLLVLTLDTHVMGWRPRDLENAFLPFLRAVGNQNYLSDPVFIRAVGGAVDDQNRLAALQHWAAVFGNPALTWDDLGFLREHWSGPIALKGILHPDDARRAADAGMDGIVVSNHGGRQVDGAVGALDALPAIVDAVGDRIEVLVDSGVMTGADVVKALALGARRGVARPPVRLRARAGGRARCEARAPEPPRGARADDRPLGSDRPVRPDSRDTGPRLTARADRHARRLQSSRGGGFGAALIIASLR